MIVYINREQNGVVSSVTQLPLCGSTMPQLDSKKINYLYLPSRGLLYFSALSNKQDYDKICKHFKLKTIPGRYNFPRHEFQGVDLAYVPSGDVIYYGYGEWVPGGRSIMRVFFDQPMTGLDDSGQLYVHIVVR